MKQVIELTGGMRGIETDDELVFPNVQTCVAVIAVVGGTLVGVHITLADRGRLSQVANQVKTRGAISALYVIGPVVGPYNISSFANFGGIIHVCNVELNGPPWLDVRALKAGMDITFYRRDTGTLNWTRIPDASFVTGG